MGDIERLNYIYPDDPCIQIKDLETKSPLQFNVQGFNEFIKSL